MPAVPFSLCIVSHNAYGTLSGKPGHVGGVEWQTSLLARDMAERGYPVSLLTWDEGGPRDEMVGRVRVVKICRRDAGLRGLRFLHPKWTGLVRALEAANADVYYHNCGECVTGQVAIWCRRHRRGFVFSAAHDADCSPGLPDLESFPERLLYRYGLRHARRIVQTEFQRKALAQGFGLDAEVIPMPCPRPTEPVEPRAKAPSRCILWVGRVCCNKQPRRFLDLAEQCAELDFELLGPIPDDASGREIKRRAGQIRNLRLHGPVPRDRLAEWYRSAACLCCTSEYEGFPNTFLEAWSHGLPIVSSFDPDRLIAARKLGVVAYSVSEMKEAIEALLVSPERYCQMSANALEYYLRHHTPDAVMPRFEQVFREVAAAFSRRRS